MIHFQKNNELSLLQCRINEAHNFLEADAVRLLSFIFYFPKHEAIT